MYIRTNSVGWMQKAIGLLKLATQSPIIVLLTAAGQVCYPCLHGHFGLERLTLNRKEDGEGIKFI